ncbi:MAG: hypothetical protein P1V51_19295 [Deltaproteobacteria bacterium]|nr:hypothetical protein [Deltaproteobacteria bacterium]
MPLLPSRRAALLASLLLLPLLAGGCATLGVRGSAPAPAFLYRSALNTPGGRFEIWYDAQDEAVVSVVRTALQRAAERVGRWGTLQRPVVVRLYPTHESLEAAVHRFGYDWLRAWARYDEIFLQSPRTFSVFERGEANLAELLTHELTHCLMYQLAAEESRWRKVDRQIPIWFREGMASWTADQGRRRVSEGRLTTWLRSEHHNPLAEAASLYRDEAAWIYGASHWAFTFLVERYGTGRVLKLMDALREGAGFGRGFESVMGLSEAVFSEEVLRYFLWEGWQDREHPTARQTFEGGTSSPAPEAAVSEEPHPATPAS